MNRLLCIGTLATIALLQLLKIADPSNLLFEVVSVDQNATILHTFFAAMLLIVGVVEYFTHKPVRIIASIAGVALIGLGISSLFYPLLDEPLKPLDLIFILEAGIILSLAGISVSEEAEQEAQLLRQYEMEQNAQTPAEQSGRKIAYN